MAKSESTKKVPVIAGDVNGSILTLTFQDGRILTLDATKVSADIQHAAMMHGFKQKLVDAAAINRNTDTGASATIDDKYDNVREVYDRLIDVNGTWNKQRGDGSGSSAGTGLLVRALMAIYGKSEDEVREILDNCSDDEVKAVRGNPKVAAKMAELKQAKSTIDVDAVLGKFGA